MSTNVYVCYTVMHIYITLLKICTNQDKKSVNILVITDHIVNFKSFVVPLRELGLFFEVIIVEDKRLNELFKKNILNALFYKRNLINFFEKETNLHNLDRFKKVHINLFLDVTRTSHYFMYKFSDISLIEDGLCLYLTKKNSIREFVKKNLLGLPSTYGRDVRIRSIEATRPENLPTAIRQKAKLLDIAMLQNSITEIEKKQIIRFFLGEDSLDIIDKKKILILTGPYSEEKIISEDYKIELYRKIIQPYLQDYVVYIKPHPRELTDYWKRLPENVILLKHNFPIELLNQIVTDKFDKCIAIDSSALKNLSCVKEIIHLGIDFDEDLAVAYYKKVNLQKKQYHTIKM